MNHMNFLSVLLKNFLGSGGGSEIGPKVDIRLEAKTNTIFILR